ncbi:uncharacterized protein LOC130357496 [Hyla sarda]|uniref:uncharacterized protein LOC130357496 n=1 Tax=Hyla sarda TaxID=327740 RepID=UPI0024C3C040|nr:uncharacterized protein LOC130357496 [Hyla sarda]
MKDLSPTVWLGKQHDNNGDTKAADDQLLDAYHVSDSQMLVNAHEISETQHVHDRQMLTIDQEVSEPHHIPDNEVLTIDDQTFTTVLKPAVPSVLVKLCLEPPQPFNPVVEQTDFEVPACSNLLKKVSQLKSAMFKFTKPRRQAFKTTFPITRPQNFERASAREGDAFSIPDSAVTATYNTHGPSALNTAYEEVGTCKTTPAANKSIAESRSYKTPQPSNVTTVDAGPCKTTPPSNVTSVDHAYSFGWRTPLSRNGCTDDNRVVPCRKCPIKAIKTPTSPNQRKFRHKPIKRVQLQFATEDNQGCSDKVNLTIVDDLMESASENNEIDKAFTKYVHHRNLSILYLVQDIFCQGKKSRTINLNTKYMVLFNNLHDKLQILTSARQMYPGKTHFFLEAFEDATREPYGHLLVDLQSITPEQYRLGSGFFPPALPAVYIPKKNSSKK